MLSLHPKSGGYCAPPITKRISARRLAGSSSRASSLSWRSAALLLLRCEGLSYLEIAAALKLNPASVGTFVARAQREFRQEFVKRYGDA